MSLELALGKTVMLRTRVKYEESFFDLGKQVYEDGKAIHLSAFIYFRSIS
jgi:hypothetical protein